MIQAITWAFQAHLKDFDKSGNVRPTALTKFTLVALANYSDDDGFCWPSFNRLMRDTQQSRRSVIKQLEKLEQLGLINREARTRENGSQTSNGYTLLYPGPGSTAFVDQHSSEGVDDTAVHEVHPPPVQDVHSPGEQGAPPSAEGAPPGVNEVHPQNRQLNRQSNRQSNQVNGEIDVCGESRQREASPLEAEFDSEFKPAYPARDGDQGWAAARRSYVKVRAGGTPKEEVLSGLEKYKAFVEATGKLGTTFVKQAATFLNPKNLLWEEDYASSSVSTEYVILPPSGPEELAMLQERRDGGGYIAPGRRP